MLFFKRKKEKLLFPEEVLLDSYNLPHYGYSGAEGKINTSLSHIIFFVVLCGMSALIFFFFLRATLLMAVSGEEYKNLAENNKLSHAPLFAERGIIFDRYGKELVWNIPYERNGILDIFHTRGYTQEKGNAHSIGYVQNPARDSSGILYRNENTGISGVELYYDNFLNGKNGVKIVETNVFGEKISESVLEKPHSGEPLFLSIDSELNAVFAEHISELAEKVSFTGGAGLLMDIESGELLAFTSVPEYDPNALVLGETEKIQDYANDERLPYLNRLITGQYTPGSIVKPFIAYTALVEGIIFPEKTLFSSGSIRIQNPYNKEEYAVFRDWKAHGNVDLKRALAVSSNVYFYTIGGGFEENKGLGISKINSYMKIFGFGKETGFIFNEEKKGIIPSPEWKKDTFPDDQDWRLGDTYHTAIGQYGFQVTPLQVARALSALANGHALITPRIETKYTPFKKEVLSLEEDALKVVREGMRLAVKEGTAQGLNVPYLSIAAKTGTAEVGYNKAFVHSWAVGYFPYEKPRYVFVVLMEEGPRANTLGGIYVMRKVLDWMNVHRKEYIYGDEEAPF